MAKNQIRITADVEASIRRCTLTGNSLVMPDLTTMKFDNWPAMKKVFDALGGKWDKKSKAVVFPSDAKALLLPAVEAGGVLNKKQHFQFFPTPHAMALSLVDRASRDIDPARVLEPSAGDGAIVSAIMEMLPDATIDCVEIQQGLWPQLRKLTGRDPIGADLFDVPSQPIYDAVVMNPPFQAGQDIQHVRRAHEFLRQGGILVSVVSAGAQANTDRKSREFRDWANAHWAVWEEIPRGTFKDSGTMVNACIVTIRA